LNLTLDLEIHQHLGSFKHVINIIMWIRDTGCYTSKQRSYTNSKTINNNNYYDKLQHPISGSERSSTTTAGPSQPRRRGLKNHNHRANAPGQPITTMHNLRPDNGHHLIFDTNHIFFMKQEGCPLLTFLFINKRKRQ
jgi:hypothetical protein